MINALATIETIAHFYGNGNEKRETSDRWVTCCPIHGDHNPSLALEIDIRKKLGYSWVCRSRNCDGSEILKRFIADGLVQKGGSYLKKDQTGALIMPVPVTAPPPPPIKPDVIRYQYLNQQGQTLLYVDRIQLDNNRKEFRPIALYTNKDNPTELGWASGFPKGFSDKPLYGLERFAYETPFLLCEGEKKVDKAAIIFGSRFVPISYQGGVNAFGGSDWSVIPKGSKIVIWPDNDDAARTTLFKNHGLVDFLTNKGYQVTIVPIWENNLPPKWDLADPLPEGWDFDKLQELVSEAKPIIYFRKTDLNLYCELSLELGDKALTHNCKTTTEPVCEFCMYKNRFNNPKEFLGLDPLHKEVILISEQNKYYVIHRDSILSEGGLGMEYARQPGYEATGKSSPHIVLKNSTIATVVSDFTSYPGKGLIIKRGNNLYANRWRHWDVRNRSNTQPQMWLELAEHIFPEKNVRDLVIQWLAHTLQHPEIKINYGMLIISPIQGIGKSLFVEPIKKLMEDSARSIDMVTFGLPYSGYLEGLKLLIIEELAATGQLKSNYNKLKTMCAAPPDELDVNEKYIKAYKIPNLVSVMAFTNKEVPIIVEDHDRRWFVYRSEVNPKPEQFYIDYVHAILYNDLGLDSLYWYLMNLDISSFSNSRIPFETTAKRELIEQSRDPLISDLMDAEIAGTYPFNSYLTTEKDIISYVQDIRREVISGAKARQLLKSMGYVNIARMQINLPSKPVDQRPVWCRREYEAHFQTLSGRPSMLAKYYLNKDRSKPLMSIVI